MREIDFQKEKNRILRFGMKFGSNGEWLSNGEDIIPVLDALVQDELIERNAKGDKWRLIVN